MDTSVRPRIMLRSAVQVGQKNQDAKGTVLRFTLRFKKMRIIYLKVYV